MFHYKKRSVNFCCKSKKTRKEKEEKKQELVDLNKRKIIVLWRWAHDVAVILILSSSVMTTSCLAGDDGSRLGPSCGSCDFVCFDSDLLLLHRAENHLWGLWCVCNLCGDKFVSSDKVITHIIEIHQAHRAEQILRHLRNKQVKQEDKNNLSEYFSKSADSEEVFSESLDHLCLAEDQLGLGVVDLARYQDYIGVQGYVKNENPEPEHNTVVPQSAVPGQEEVDPFPNHHSFLAPGDLPRSNGPEPSSNPAVLPEPKLELGFETLSNVNGDRINGLTSPTPPLQSDRNVVPAATAAAPPVISNVQNLRDPSVHSSSCETIAPPVPLLPPPPPLPAPAPPRARLPSVESGPSPSSWFPFDSTTPSQTSPVQEPTPLLAPPPPPPVTKEASPWKAFKLKRCSVVLKPLVPRRSPTPAPPLPIPPPPQPPETPPHPPETVPSPTPLVLAGSSSSSSCQIKRPKIISVFQKVGYSTLENGKARCLICKKTMSLQHVKKHIQEVHTMKNVRPFACPHCQHKSKRSSDLKTHIDYVHKKLKRVMKQPS